MKSEILAYINALQDVHNGVINKPLATVLYCLETFVADFKEEQCKSTLELEQCLRESARQYKTSLAERECTITELSTELHSTGYKLAEVEELKTKVDQLENYINSLNSINNNMAKEIKKLRSPQWVE